MSISNQPPSAEVLDTLNPNKVILPILLSVGIVVALFIKDFEFGAFNNIDWSLGTAFWFGVAVLCVVVRHFALMYRIRLLTDNKLSWRQSFDIISLWGIWFSGNPFCSRWNCYLSLSHHQRKNQWWRNPFRYSIHGFFRWIIFLDWNSCSLDNLGKYTSDSKLWRTNRSQRCMDVLFHLGVYDYGFLYCCNWLRTVYQPQKLQMVDGQNNFSSFIQSLERQSCTGRRRYDYCLQWLKRQR